jgi:glycosyltransferase involved in cell wall biosynthesis
VRVLIDGTAVRFGGIRTYATKLLESYPRVWPDDDVTVVAGEGLALPPGVERVSAGLRVMENSRADLYLGGGMSRVVARTKPDVFLSLTPTLPVGGLSVPSVVACMDLRHLSHPREFSLSTRLKRRLLYGSGFRHAAKVIAISSATANECANRGLVERDRLRVVYLGGDHTLSWQKEPGPAGGWALAFAQHTNKGLDATLAAWRLRYASGRKRPELHVVGAAKEVRARLEGNLPPNVVLHPYLPAEEFEKLFSGAACVLLPSTCEGFGLPVVEAFYLGRPIVISSDPALTEVAGGHAVALRETEPEAIAEAVDEAIASSPEQISAAKRHGETFTWERCAYETGLVLREAASGADGV